MLDCTVVVGTFGEQEWADLARERAIPSAEALGCPVVHKHAATLHDARNRALAQVDTEFVVHLDADDALDTLYLDAMSSGTADVRACAVQYIRNGRPLRQRVPRVAGHRHACEGPCLLDGNFIAIGACVRAQLLRDVGGWWPEPIYEDWSAFLRCYLAGGTVETIPSAVYRAWVNPQSRNRAPSMEFKNRVHAQIIASCLPAAA